MIRQCAAALGTLALSCSFYTSCPKGQRVSSGQCVSDGSNPGNNAGGNGGDQNPVILGTIPSAPWNAATGNLDGMPAGYGSICYVSPKPDEDLLITGISAAGLWASRDGGQSWQLLGTKPGSAPVPNRPNLITYDPEHPEVFWEAGPYGEGVFQTKDNGDTFERLGKLENNDAIGIDFTDPNRQTLVASGHEQGHILYRTTDGGSNWQDISGTFPPDANACNYPVLVDGQTYLVGCSQFGGGLGGIYRTVDSGASWERVSEVSAWASPLLSSDGSIYWPIESDNGLLRSTDQGLTWSRVIAGSTLTVHPLELPDGRIVTITKECAIASSDHGATWRRVSSQLPFVPAGIAYSTFQKAFFVWYLSPTGAVPGDSIMRFDFDFEVE